MRRSCGLHYFCWPCACVAAWFLCCVMIKLDQSPIDGQGAKGVQILSTLWNRKENASLPNTSTPPGPLENFECPENDTLMGVPTNIPLLHQEFLRYKHCRRFRTLLTPTSCEDDLYLLLAIKSTALHIDRRAALRDTWGRAGLVNGRSVKLIFLMGHSDENMDRYALQPLLEWENRQFGDILQWDFKDSFFNLTLKEVSFLSWFGRSCHWAQFVLKGDDDVFVHTENVIEYLNEHSPNEHLFVGDILPRSYPIRDSDVKYFIPAEMYPNGKPYPPYAGGGGYLMSRKTVVGLDAAAAGVDLFPIDDVYVGMCLQRMGVQPHAHTGFRTFGFHNIMAHFNPCAYRNLMLVHKLRPVEMWVMWALVQDSGLACSQGAH
ncbi:N-acetyllactosaminide beta-1,3-N-acetylglucosaminyltransferase 4-like [Denticeps clupeoides]|uniref:Hexosyltransferase n=1 Tax=Denticeps clupeoides TaxID=299321 RepID=A0AAY4CZ86_9TELE|nr:N-acetyllactosaminide beta-1,3-N-acetylglucosaminyltransferase 4 [Denticeps clupeoides]XP_028852492.1 N-acetyllactosaminide beta-1,3-N-acetylglucosaminyltransferase 4 [Denticeps clupeoides]